MSSNNKKNDKNKHRWYSIDSEESLPTAPDGDEYYVYPYDDTGDDNSVPSECFNYFCNAKSIGTLFARVFLFSFFLPNFFFLPRASRFTLSLSLCVPSAVGEPLFLRFLAR
jgi:hypothetical protein